MAAGWDSHEQLTDSLCDFLLPGLDRGLSALLTDMQDRGLLDDTLVVTAGEMGCTPNFMNCGKHDGRDHWSYCFPAVLAGAGVQGGHDLRSFRQTRSLPSRSPRLLLRSCGDSVSFSRQRPHGFIPDRQGRPVELASGGRVLEEIFA